MKKILLISFSLLVAFMLIACGGQNNDTNSDEGTDSSTSIDSSVASDTSSETSTEQDSATDTSEESDSDNVDTETETDTDTESDTTPSYSVPSVEQTLKNELEVFETDNYGNEGKTLSSTIEYQLNL